MKVKDYRYWRNVLDMVVVCKHKAWGLSLCECGHYICGSGNFDALHEQLFAVACGFADEPGSDAKP